MENITWKHRFGFIILTGLIYAGVMILFGIFDQDGINWQIILFQSLVFGVLFGLTYPFLLKKTSAKLEKSIISPELSRGESIVFETAANRFRNALFTDGGKLFLNDERLIFVPHKFNIKAKTVSINLKDIKQINPRKTMGLVDNGLRVETTNGKFDFVVNTREKWLELLKYQKPEAQTA